MIRTLTTVILLALMGVRALAVPGLPAPGTLDGLGVNIHFTDASPAELGMIQRGGFRWARMDYDWSAIERTPGQYDFSAYDRLVSILAARGIRAMLILDYVHPRYDGGVSPHTPAARAAFARWAAASVRHFRGRGVMWEMYNEPNISFWKPQPKVADYILLAKAVGAAIRAAAPGELYVGPATSKVDFPFLEACFRAGLLAMWDAVTVHPYRSKAPETAADEYRALRAMIARYAPAGKHIPVISGEWGYTDVATGLTVDRQGRYLARQWLTNLASAVPVSIWYDWHDDGPDPKEGEHHFGTVFYPGRADGVEPYDAKPAYIAARTLTTVLRGFTFDKAIATGRADDHVLLFRRGDEVRIAAWSEVATPHSAVIPAGPGTFRAVSHTGEAMPPCRAGAGGLRVSMTDAPVYLIPTSPNPLLRAAAAWSACPLDVVCGSDATVMRTLFRNPLRTPVQVAMPPDAPLQTVRPGAIAAFRTRFAVDRALQPTVHAVALRLRVGGSAAVIRQRTWVASTRPIGIGARLASEREVRIGIESPLGGALRGTLTTTVRAGARTSTTTTRVALTSGQTGAQVRVPAPAGASADLHVTAVLRDRGGAVITQLPPSRILRLDLGAATCDAQPSGLAVVPDGRAAVAEEYDLIAAASPDLRNAPSPIAFRLRYRMGEGEKFLRVETTTATRRALPGRPRSLGLWIYGDGQNNFPRMRFIDATGQQFQTDGWRITWRGWQYMVFPLTGADSTHSGGADDGAIHYPIRVEAPLVMWNGFGRAVQGDLWFACPSVIY